MPFLINVNFCDENLFMPLNLGKCSLQHLPLNSSQFWGEVLQRTLPGFVKFSLLANWMWIQTLVLKFSMWIQTLPLKRRTTSQRATPLMAHILIPKSRTITLQILGLLFAVQQPQQLIWVQDCRCNLREPQALPLMAPFARWNTSHNPTFGRSRLPSPSICFLLRVALHEWLNNRWNFEYAQNYFQCTLN